jgi:hypothetical protein
MDLVQQLLESGVPAQYLPDFFPARTGPMLISAGFFGEANSQTGCRGTFSLLDVPRPADWSQPKHDRIRIVLQRESRGLRVPPQQDANEGMLKTAGKLYCRMFHRTISRPVEGKYRCWKCLREFELEW